jgi:DNA-binding transcriptional LysR family regulator
MKRIALYHLETLYWINQLGTFRGAAERLNTSQPAISARVREVEEQLGVELFQRQGRRMLLNARGRRLVDTCEPMRSGLERSLLEISDYAGATGMVRIGSGEIAAASCLPAFIQAMQREMPRVVMEVDVDLTARMLQHLLVGTIDLAFVAGPVTIPGVLTAPIGSLELCWAAAPGLADRGVKADTPIWSLPAMSPLHAVTLDTLANNGLPHHSIHTCSNVRMLIDIIMAGDAAAVLPETMVREDLCYGRLTEILPRPKRRIHFEVAIRNQERDPVLVELYNRASLLRVDIPTSEPENQT